MPPPAASAERSLAEHSPAERPSTQPAPTEHQPAVPATVDDPTTEHPLVAGPGPEEAPVVENRPPYVLPDAQTDEWVNVPAPRPPSPPLVVPSRPPELSPNDPWAPPSDVWAPPSDAWAPPSDAWAPPSDGREAPTGRSESPATAGSPDAAGRPAAPTYPAAIPGLAIPGQSPPLGSPAAAGQPSGTGTRDPGDTAPLPVVVTEEYRGRRRARHRARRLSPRSFVVVGVLVVLSAAVAVPFLVPDRTNPSTAGFTPPTVATSTSAPTTPPVTASEPATTTEAGVPVIVAPSVTPTPSATPTPAPWSLTLQAESVPNSALGGGAVKRGDVVDFVGAWWNRRSAGWLEFRGIQVPEAGAEYRLRVYHRYEAYCGCQPRRLEVWVNGTRVQTWEFTAPDPGVREVTVTLGAGDNTIRLTHPRSASPAIDRIEITRP